MTICPKCEAQLEHSSSRVIAYKQILQLEVVKCTNPLCNYNTVTTTDLLKEKQKEITIDVD